MNPHADPDLTGRRHGQLVPIQADETPGSMQPATTHQLTVAQQDEVRSLVAHVTALARAEATRQPQPVGPPDDRRSPLAEPGVWVVLVMLALVAVVAIVATVAVLALAVAGG